MLTKSAGFLTGEIAGFSKLKRTKGATDELMHEREGQRGSKGAAVRFQPRRQQREVSPAVALGTCPASRSTKARARKPPPASPSSTTAGVTR